MCALDAQKGRQCEPPDARQGVSLGFDAGVKVGQGGGLLCRLV